VRVTPAAPAVLPLRTALPAVAAGGVLGALARHGLTAGMGSPEATLTANLLGCLLIGLLVGARRGDLLLRAFAGTGVLGGFTTMSAFAVEADRLDPAPALAYVVASVVGGLVLARAGLRLASRS
jgi:CrcB protein